MGKKVESARIRGDCSNFSKAASVGPVQSTVVSLRLATVAPLPSRSEMDPAGLMTACRWSNIKVATYEGKVKVSSQQLDTVRSKARKYHCK